MNHRAGLPLAEFTSFMISAVKFRSHPLSWEVPPLLRLGLTQPGVFRASQPGRQTRAANATPMKAKVNRAVSQKREHHTSDVRQDLLACAE